MLLDVCCCCVSFDVWLVFVLILVYVEFGCVVYLIIGDGMIEFVIVCCVGVSEVMVCVDVLVDVLIDCVEGGVFVSFMLLIVWLIVVVFWMCVVDGVVNDECILFVVEDVLGWIVGIV